MYNIFMNGEFTSAEGAIKQYARRQRRVGNTEEWRLQKIASPAIGELVNSRVLRLAAPTNYELGARGHAGPTAIYNRNRTHPRFLHIIKVERGLLGYNFNPSAPGVAVESYQQGRAESLEVVGYDNGCAEVVYGTAHLNDGFTVEHDDGVRRAIDHIEERARLILAAATAPERTPETQALDPNPFASFELRRYYDSLPGLK